MIRWKHFATEGGPETLAAFQGDQSGLSVGVAKERLRIVGYNRPEETKVSLGALLRRRVSSPFLFLLAAAGFLSGFLGDALEAFLIFLFLFINIGLETFQEHRAERAVRLLRRYLSFHTRVRRAGGEYIVDSTEVVPGDIVLVSAGDRLPADLRWLSVRALALDESLVTGESFPVAKEDRTLPHPPATMRDASNIGFSGTVVTAGSGEGIVFAAGKETALNDTALLSGQTEHQTVFERGMIRLSRFVVRLVLGTLLILYLANLLIKGDGANAAELLIFSIALAVSVVPEALPVILTVALSRGSLRLARKKVVVKRLSAIEDLGSIEILCMDKTGTLTENALTVRETYSPQKQRTVERAFLASLEEPTSRERLHDPFDLALWRNATPLLREKVRRWRRLNSIPFDPERRRNSVFFQEDRHVIRLVVRGSVQEVLSLTTDLSAMERRALRQWSRDEGKQGRRVLAIAERTLRDGEMCDVAAEKNLQWVGLVAFEDTLKKTTRETLDRARALHLKLKILSGDDEEVVGAVAYAAGLTAHPEKVMTGDALEDLPYEKRRLAVWQCDVFARVSPRQKYDIIKLLQERYSVGFLGEGMNDAPALRLSDVGMVVDKASDVARETADVVLLRKNLETIVDGIREGRIIFSNILKYLKITLASNFGNFYSVAVASLFFPFIPLLPVQILLLNLLSDFPMIAIATDRVDEEDLEKPKRYEVHSVVLIATLLGIVSSIFDLILFRIFFHASPETLQTSWFLLSVVTEVMLIFSLRSRRAFFFAGKPSFSLLFCVAAATLISFSLPFFESAREAFHFVAPTAFGVLTLVLLVAGYFVATELVKRLYYSRSGLLVESQVPIALRKNTNNV